MGAGHSSQRVVGGLARLDREAGLGRQSAAGSGCRGTAFIWARLQTNDRARGDVIGLLAGKLGCQIRI